MLNIGILKMKAAKKNESMFNSCPTSKLDVLRCT